MSRFVNKLRSLLSSQSAGTSDVPWYADIQRSLSEMVSNPAIARTRYEDPLREVSELLSDVKANAKRIVFLLGGISTWLDAVGANQVLSGNSDGWRQIGRALSYDSVSQDLGFYLREKGEFADEQDSAAYCFFRLLHFIAIDWRDEANRLGAQLLRGVDAGSIGYLSGTAFEPFCFWLYERWSRKSSREIDVDPLKLGEYGPLVAAWNGMATDLRKGLLRACDFHIEQSREPLEGSDEEAPFPIYAYDLYNVFPVEILAIFRIRELAGLETPAIDHPLLESPLAKGPQPFVRPRDEVLEAVHLQATAAFPDLY